MKRLRTYLLPMVVHPRSDEAILWLQQSCGVRGEKDKNMAYYLVFRVASALGEEIFAGIPLLFWFAWHNVALNFSSAFFLLVIGQLFKDLLRLPRPTNPRIVKLERTFETEFGLPSTHTMSGFMPLALFISWHRHSSSVSPLLLPLGVVCTLGVGLLVGTSRLYLGVHSLMDVASGGLLGLLGIVVLLHPQYGLCDTIDELVYRSPLGIFVSLALLLWFSVAYPKTNPWSASYATAAQIFGTWFGIAASSWLVYNLENWRWISHALSKSSSIPFAWTCPQALWRLMIGLSLCGVAKVGGKAIGISLSIRLLELGVTGRSDGEEKIAIKKLYCVEVFTRVLNYALLSFSVIIMTPVCWRLFGLI